MKEIARAINEIQSISGRNDKIQELLRQSANTPGLKEVLRFIYNPYIKTGIASTKLNKGIHNDTTRKITPQEAIDYFTENQTGSGEDVAYAWSFINSQWSSNAHVLAKAFVTKNLKIGLSTKSLNTVFGGDFIPKMGCMLGDHYATHKHKVKGPYIATEKIDGIRRILIKENGKSRLFSRSGIEDVGLIEIEAEAKYLPDNHVYDGELAAMGEYDNAIVLRQATNSIANRKGERTGVSFNIFDIVPLDEFKTGVSKHGAADRKALLGALFGDDGVQHLRDDWAKLLVAYGMHKELKFIKAVPILGTVNTDEEITEMVAPIWARGGEGIMLNTMNGKYEIKRSRQLLKVKFTKSLDLRVTGYTMGRPDSKYEGVIGALVVDYKGYKVGVGSGLSDEERQSFFEDPSLIVGKTIEIDTFGESKDHLGNISLNCPIFRGVRYDK